VSATLLLERVLAGDGLSIVVQPLGRIAGTSRAVAGFEFLSRGPAATNLERPEVLFGYARQRGLEAELDFVCLRAAVAAAVPVSMNFAVPLFFNVHGSSIERGGPAWVDALLGLFDRHGLEPSRVVLEIVEHVPFRPSASCIGTVDRLRGVGLRFALDDFGSRNSGLALLLECRPEILKVDLNLVRDCHRDLLRAAILRNLARFAGEVGMLLVAEGVESEGESQALLGLGIDWQQGFAIFPVLDLASVAHLAESVHG
jgi:EAL domain-containing protein (putative c-di-GMP-specific phosphodiesterase class I)